jgi:hypothetical protein
MEKLLEVCIGGGDTYSGWVPVSAYQMLHDLIEAVAEQGGDPKLWQDASPQLEVVGTGSTKAAVRSHFAVQLRPAVRTFRRNAAAGNLGPKGRRFIERNFKSGVPWGYLDVREAGNKRSPSIRFDIEYRERILRNQPQPLTGHDEIYARVIRAGGYPEATVKLAFGEEDVTADVKNLDLAKQLAKRLYEEVKLSVEVEWDTATGRIEGMRVLEILDWESIHLGDLYDREGRLPIKSSYQSVDELLASRNKDRSE